MRLTLYTDYGVRVLLYLAAAPDQHGTVRQISDAYGISAHHVSKVAARLAASGLVSSQTGRSGGLTLLADPDIVTLADVVRITENDMAIVECMGEHGSCVVDGVCAARSAFHRARNAFLDELDRMTLSGAARNRQGMQVALQIAGRTP